ncbi:DUF3540 domain-containing protein [Sodalis ligni]|uniref:DUF3540 domain-containing protein n=1 Tax=Sodalis ligni TaxID=2697027 RepID=UPI00193EEC55|nr:DUF3540 domain-containing protein [Sodalis ligni]QWA11550.1 DUF3540 domain-containing protein [Sodalis ligni]
MLNQEKHCTPAVTPPAQAVGQVVNLLPDGFFIVKHRQRGWQCRLAASCLLVPQAGDEVLIAGNGQQLWLLAILTRADRYRPFSLSVDGDLHITPQGTLTLASADKLALHSQTLDIDARRGDCRIDSLHYRGNALSAWVGNGSIVGRCLESVWETVVSISQRLLRKVTQTEHVRVGQWDCEAEDYARLHGKHLLMTSDAITKLDAEQIHVG